MKTLKKNILFTTKHIYTYGQTFSSFMKFYFVHIINSHYAYIPLYIHKALPTFANEKEQ